MKRERKDSGISPKDEHDDDDGDEEYDKHMGRRRDSRHNGRNHMQREYSNGNPESRRTGTKEHGYFDSNSNQAQARGSSGRDQFQKPTFRDYRETAVFSDDGNSPSGNLPCSKRERRLINIA